MAIFTVHHGQLYQRTAPITLRMARVILRTFEAHGAEGLAADLRAALARLATEKETYIV